MSDTVILAGLAFAGSVFTAVFGWLTRAKVAKVETKVDTVDTKVDSYHKEVDGMKTELVAAVKAKGEAEGELKGLGKATDIANTVTDTIKADPSIDITKKDK